MRWVWRVCCFRFNVGCCDIGLLGFYFTLFGGYVIALFITILGFLDCVRVVGFGPVAYYGFGCFGRRCFGVCAIAVFGLFVVFLVFLLCSVFCGVGII